MVKTRGEGSSRGARNDGSDEEEQIQRRTTSRGRTTSSSSSLPMRFFWNQEGHRLYHEDDVYRRKGTTTEETRITAGNDRTIFPGIALELVYLRCQYFDNLADLFEFQGWELFLNKANPYEPSMIRQFYHNLVPQGDSDEPSRYRTKIYGRTVNVSAKIFAQHFFNTNELNGACVNGQNFTEFCPNYVSTDARRSMLEPNCSNLNSSLVSDMTIENRLLFHILTKVIVPRSGSYTKATDFDIGIMFFIKNRIKICLPHLMFSHVARISHNRMLACVYAMPITDFLVNGCDVPSNKNDSTVLKKKFYDDGTLGLMFSRNKNSNRWERKFISRNLRSNPIEEPSSMGPSHDAHHVSPSHDYPPFTQEFPPSSFEPTSSHPPQNFPPPSFESSLFHHDIPSSSYHDIPSSSHAPPPQSSFDFYSFQNTQNEMFSMIRQMNDNQNSFANDMRLSMGRIESRQEEQERNIREMNDELERLMRNFPYN